VARSAGGRLTVRGVRGTALAVAAAAALAVIASVPAQAAASDPLCLGSYGNATPDAGGPIRFGIDPGLAGTAGGVQLPSVPDDPARDLQAARALRPPGHPLVVRLNRLFWSDGDAGIAHFRRQVAAYTRAGFYVEIQVRYHPPAGEAGDIAAWDRYVRHVVDRLGGNRRVIAMTITNEVNLTFSPNTSDGYYRGAPDALIGGLESAHSEAQRRGFRWLRFGFTFAYRLLPTADSAFFSYLGAHGGAPFLRALSFVGLDFYPGTVYPPVMIPGDTYTAEMAQALGSMRDCFMPLARIGPRTPIWITEDGLPTGVLSDTQQAAALRELVLTAHDYSRTFNVTDYRWFNLRDSVSGGLAPLVGLTFASDGLLRADYTAKPSFLAYRSLIATLGTRSKRTPRRHHHR
jgi:hypothetical protein